MAIFYVHDGRVFNLVFLSLILAVFIEFLTNYSSSSESSCLVRYVGTIIGERLQ